MKHIDHQAVANKWLQDFSELDSNGPPASFTARQLSGLYAVASICYHGNDRGIMTDEAFDRLCRWLAANFDECVAVGADMLDLDLLRACSGHRVQIFVKAYHDISAMLLGHPCQCFVCRTRHDDKARAA